MRGVCLYTIKPGNPGSFRKLHTLANSMFEQIQKRNRQKKVEAQESEEDVL